MSHIGFRLVMDAPKPVEKGVALAAR